MRSPPFVDDDLVDPDFTEEVWSGDGKFGKAIGLDREATILPSLELIGPFASLPDASVIGASSVDLVIRPH